MWESERLSETIGYDFMLKRNVGYSTVPHVDRNRVATTPLQSFDSEIGRY